MSEYDLCQRCGEKPSVRTIAIGMASDEYEEGQTTLEIPRQTSVCFVVAVCEDCGKGLKESFWRLETRWTKAWRAAGRQKVQEPEVIEIRDLTDAEAEKEIVGLFRSEEGTLYYGDVVERLGLDLEQVVRICNKLIDEGRLESDDST